LGCDPVWCGVLVMLLIETAMITPPAGINPFVVRSRQPSRRACFLFDGRGPRARWMGASNVAGEKQWPTCRLINTA
jgi:TRAP-type mannitol/chloroaromatic compound transport system permease large subunit